VLLEDGDLEAARLEAEALATAWNTEPAVHAIAAEVALATGRAREAETAARRALGLDPLLSGGHRLLGEALVAQGRLGEAADWLDRWRSLERRESERSGDDADVSAAIQAARTLELYLRGRRG
jgi:predicted Zn-dependent protease